MTLIKYFKEKQNEAQIRAEQCAIFQESLQSEMEQSTRFLRNVFPYNTQMCSVYHQSIGSTPKIKKCECREDGCDIGKLIVRCIEDTLD